MLQSPFNRTELTKSINKPERLHEPTFRDWPPYLSLSSHQLVRSKNQSILGTQLHKPEKSLPRHGTNQAVQNHGNCHSANMQEIYDEGNPELYSKNFFSINKAEQFQGLIIQVGSISLKLVRHLDIWIPFCSTDDWPSLFNFLAEKATGLRHVKIGFGPETAPFFQIGCGCDLDLVRALGKFQGLDELDIEGYYSKHWPAYL